MITVKNCKILNSLPNILEGQVAYCEEENQYFAYSKENGWYLTSKDDLGNPSMTQYDLNKMLYADKAPLADEALAEGLKRVSEYAKAAKQQYYMLLCKDINYYTLFKVDNTNSSNNPIEAEVLACIEDLGEVLDIVNMLNYVELWFKDNESNVYCALLFNYDSGVIEVRN